MTPQTEVVTLNTTQPTLLKVSAYGANTLRLSCVGDLSTGFDTLKAELHETRTVGGTPLAEVEYDSALGAGPHVLEFTAAQMNQMPNDDRIRTKAFYLVVLGRNGSGASIVKTTLANIELTLWQSPAGDTAPAPPAPATYATQEYVDDAIAGVEAGSGATNISITRTSTAVTVVSDSGTDGTIAAADASNAGVLTAADKSKLDGISSGATANATNAELRDRNTHTGTQAISTVDGLQVALDAKDSNLNDALAEIDAEFARLSMADDYAGVDPTGATDSKAALQAAIDAVATAGGGILMLTAGATYRVDPGATGIGLLLRTGVRLAGLATILFTASTASAAYTGISPYAHNTTTTAYGAHELDIQDIALGCDDTTSVHTHSLLGINHCPKASIRNVRLLGAYYHGIEVNKSRHIHIRGCRFSGNYRSSQLQIDIGSSGVISTSGAAGTNYIVEDVLIEGCHFGPRDDASLAHDGAGFTGIELTHTSSSMILRNVRIINNTFYSAVENAATASTQRGVIGSLGSTTAELTGVVIQRNHFISLAGTGNAYGLYITQASSALIRGIDFSHNTFTGGWKSLVYISGPTGGESALSIMATATEFPEISGVRIIGNTATLRLNANGVSSGSRVMRCFSVSGVADAVISSNVVTLDNVIDSNWTSGSFVATTPCHFILANHVRDLTLEDNRFSVLLTSVSFQFYGIVIAVCGFEASGISYNQRIRGNNLTAANSTGLLYAGYVHSSSVLRSAWPNPPKGRGVWENNVSTNTGSSRGATFFWPIGGGTNGVYTYGLPDWRPGYDRIGEKVKAPSAPGGGWRALAGTAFASLTNEEQHAWQYQLAQGATALPTETDTYVRLAGSEQNPIALNNTPATEAWVTAGLAAFTGTSNIVTVGTITSGTWSGTTIAVNKGGTGLTSATAYAVLCGGTTSTGAFQSVSGLGTAGQVLTSNGAGALPTWQDATGGGGGSVAWGAITGTLSDQTDLQSAIGAKADTSHNHAGEDITSGTIATARLSTSGGGIGASDSGKLAIFGVTGGLSAVDITLFATGGGDEVVISASGITDSRTLDCPDASGTIATQEWATANISGSGSPGGSDTELQFNDSGSFGAVAGLTVNKTTGAITQLQTSLGTTPAAGITLTNTTAAAAGAQQVSPASVWTGQGWKTTATAASQQVDFRAYTLPVQGTSAPTATWKLQSQIASGGWTDRLTVDSQGTVTVGGPLNAGTGTFSGNCIVAGNVVIGGDLTLARAGAGTLRLGSSDTVSPTAQTLRVQSVSIGTSNTAGANFTIQGSRGTGTGAGGDIIFQVTSPGSSGTSQNAYATALTLKGDAAKCAVFAGVVCFPAMTVASLPAAASYPYARGFVTDSNTTLAAGIGTTVASGGSGKVPVFSDGTNWIIG